METTKVQETISKLIDLFRDEESLPEKIAVVTFPTDDCPSVKWSLCNRLTMLMNNTDDARGYRQWQEVGRQVKPGSKAFYILAPRVIKKKG